jgi:hypothetical protein
VVRLLLVSVLLANVLVVPCRPAAKTSATPLGRGGESAKSWIPRGLSYRARAGGQKAEPGGVRFVGSAEKASARNSVRASKGAATALKAAAATTAATSAAAASTFKVVGSVTYADGTGSPGVTLTLTGPQTLSAQTDADGNFEIADVPFDLSGYNLSAAKPSYTFGVKAPIHIDPNSNQVVRLVGVSQTPQWEPANVSFGSSWIRTANQGGRIQAQAILSFPSKDFRVNGWGQVSVSGGSFTISPTVEHWTGNTSANATSAAQFFDLGALKPGSYALTLKVSGATVKTEHFTVSASPPANPIDNTTEYVIQNYADFLSRPPDQSGLQFWTGGIESCGSNQQCREVKRVDTSAAFFLSIEFQQTGFLVDRMYIAAYGRRPSFSEFTTDARIIGDGLIVGQTGWEQKLEANKSAFADDFISRPEFVARYASFVQFSDFSGYVSALVQNTGVSFTQAEQDALVNGLTAGTETFATVLRKVAENDTFSKAEFNPAFVLTQYFGYLRRDPDDAGFQFWLSKLNQFHGDYVQAEMVKAFITSFEYRSRFDRSQLILSQSSAGPCETLQLQAADFTPGATTAVVFSDSNGYSIQAPATTVTNSTLSVQVPIYFDKAHSKVGPGAVKVRVTQSFAGEQRQIGTGLAFQIGDLPQLTSAPGKVTAFVLSQLGGQLGSDQTIYQLIQKRSSDKVSTQALVGHLSQIQSDINSEANVLQGIANGTTPSVKLGSVGGHDLALDQNSLALMDRIFVACLAPGGASNQALSAAKSSPRPSGLSSGLDDDIDPNIVSNMLREIASDTLQVGEKIRGNFFNLLLVAGIADAILGTAFVAPAAVALGAIVWCVTTMVPLAESIVLRTFANDLQGFQVTPHTFEEEAKFGANALIDAASMYDGLNIKEPTAAQLIANDQVNSAAKLAADLKIDQAFSFGNQADQNLPAVVNPTDCTGTDGDEPDGDSDDPDYCNLATGGSTAPINFQP